jgi:ribonuclease R
MSKKPIRKNNSRNNNGKLSNQILQAFAANPEKAYTAADIKHKLRLKTNKEDVISALEVLEARGLLKSGKGHKYKWDEANTEEARITAGKSDAIIGKVDLTRNGAAYIVTKNDESDVYVSAKNVKNAMNSDLVKVEITRENKNGKREGRIVEIIRRALTHTVGTLKIYENYALVLPEMNSKFPEVIVKPIETKNAKDGDKVLVEIVKWGSRTNDAIWGKVLEILPRDDYNEFSMQSILVNAGFNPEFPEEVLREVMKITGEISEEEINRRRDMREVLCFTIDPETAKDFDDAISLKRLENGNYEIGVHIADVTHYLKEGSLLDKEAFKRSTSVYLVDRVSPMLPEKLSNDLCSLNPNEDKLCFSAVFEFSEDFRLIGTWLGKTIIHSDRRFTYEEAQERLESGTGDLHEELILLNKIAHHLRKERFQNGSINFESDEIRFVLDENNKPIGIKIKERIDAHMLVEDFMLLANKAVAIYISKKTKPPVPFVYRIHDMPDISKLNDFAVFARALGYQGMRLNSPKEIAVSFNKLTDLAHEDPRFKVLQPLAIRTMAKAEYSIENIGHYGLGFEHYTHFTSPIRRYSDVLVHRILFDNLAQVTRYDKDKLSTMCKHISEQERKAMDAERESTKFKQAEYHQEKIGESFVALVTGMIDRGIFVEIVDTRGEGLIKFENIPDWYILSANKMSAVSKKTGHELKLGDKVKVKLTDVSLSARQLEFTLLETLN